MIKRNCAGSKCYGGTALKHSCLLMLYLNEFIFPLLLLLMSQDIKPGKSYFSRNVSLLRISAHLVLCSFSLSSEHTHLTMDKNNPITMMGSMQHSCVPPVMEALPPLTAPLQSCLHPAPSPFVCLSSGTVLCVAS